MADTCFVEDGEPSAPSKPRPSRTSRRRKMEFLPLNTTIIADVHKNETKRGKVHLLFPRECEKTELNEDSVGDREVFTVPMLAPALPKYGMTSVCGRRRDMEDSVSVHPLFSCRRSHVDDSLHFFGVFDGHGCCHVAKSCENRMHEIVKEEIENEGESTMEWKKIMHRSFVLMDDEVKEYNHDGNGRWSTCRCELRTPQQYDTVGSTALVAVLTPDKIIVSNCGDSRALLCRNGVVIPLSSDHKPDRLDELFRIVSAGGRVMYWDGPRVQGILAMSRAIGDRYLKPYVIAEPEVVILDRMPKDEFMILASDGLWDVVSNESACGAVRMFMRAQEPVLPQGSMGASMSSDSDKTCSDASIFLTKLAMSRHSSDNISVIVIDLRKKVSSQW